MLLAGVSGDPGGRVSPGIKGNEEELKCTWSYETT